MVWGLDGCALWRKVTITFTIKYMLALHLKIIEQFWNKIGLGLGCLRAAAQGDNYNCNKIEWGNNFEII